MCQSGPASAPAAKRYVGQEVMKRRSIGILVAILLIVGARMASKYSPLDGIPGMIIGSLPLGEDTVYAKNYSYSRFSKVHVGMSEAQVNDIIGAPLWKSSNGDSSESWGYTRSPGSNNYRCRVIVFDHGIVESKHAEFYID